jgi:hypothetical protein
VSPHVRDDGLTRRGVDACRAALETYGLLLVQDAALPDARAARTSLEGAVQAFGGAGWRTLVPWPAPE